MATLPCNATCTGGLRGRAYLSQATPRQADQAQPIRAVRDNRQPRAAIHDQRYGQSFWVDGEFVGATVDVALVGLVSSATYAYGWLTEQFRFIVAPPISST
jgi:hypothetical protein